MGGKLAAIDLGLKQRLEAKLAIGLEHLNNRLDNEQEAKLAEGLGHEHKHDSLGLGNEQEANIGHL